MIFMAPSKLTNIFYQPIFHETPADIVVRKQKLCRGQLTYKLINLKSRVNYPEINLYLLISNAVRGD